MSTQFDDMMSLVTQVRMAIAVLPEYGALEVFPFLPEHGGGGIVFTIRLPEYPDRTFEAHRLQYELACVVGEPGGLRGHFEDLLARTRHRLTEEGMPV
jgi:hypothetical protein